MQDLHGSVNTVNYVPLTKLVAVNGYKLSCPREDDLSILFFNAKHD